MNQPTLAGRLGVALTLLLTLGLAGCTGGDGVVVHGPGAGPPGSSLPTASSPTPPATASGPELSQAEAVRVLADDGVTADDREAAERCPDCVALGPVLRLDGLTAQVVFLDSLGDGARYAGYLIAEGPRGPEVAASLQGTRLKISQGKDAQLVVTDDVFGPDDPVCCPSGSKTTWFRWSSDHLVQVGERYSTRTP